MDALNSLLFHARQSSDFFRQFYQKVPNPVSQTSEIPIMDQTLYWEENRRSSQRLQSKNGPAMAFRSGGTTGQPKFTVCSHSEIEIMARAVGPTLASAGLKTDDRVALCLAVGDLNASFLFYSECLKYCGLNVLVFPIGNSLPPEAVWKTIEENNINVIFAMPTYLASLFQFYNLSSNSARPSEIQKLFFLGEHFSEHHARIIAERHPDVVTTSAGHTSVDVGIMGFAELGSTDGEHRVFDDALLEIVYVDSDQVIQDINRPGRLVCTNLVRYHMPVIRYPVGDICVWLEPEGTPNRKYKLLGRAPESWSLAAASYQFSDLEEILKPHLGPMQITAFQIKLMKLEGKDKLVVHLGTTRSSEDPHLQADSRRLIEQLILELPNLKTYINHIWPIEIIWTNPDGLEKNTRTGKLKRVIDSR